MTTIEPAQVFVCYHKPGEILKSQCIRPIQVGREASRVLLEEMIGDNTGDHISSRNNNFCELTALYWAWRNVEAQYYGLMHYRRVFDFTDQFDDIKCYGLDNSTQQKLGLDDHTIRSALDSCDVILPKSVDVSLWQGVDSVRDHYCREHLEEDLHLLRTAIQAKAPHTLDDFDTVFSGKETYFYNMFVMRREVFHAYTAWLFSILFEVDSQIELHDRDQYQKRVFGFMGERLLTVYIQHCRRSQGLRIRELPVVFVTNESPPGIGHAFQSARRRYVQMRFRRDSIYLKLFGWEFRRGKEACSQLAP